MSRVLMVAGLASAALCVWCAVSVARAGTGSRTRPRPVFDPWIEAEVCSECGTERWR